ncbi:Protein grpE [Candidatus Johnevansia muelleri]|uniref:Protein GrpE n=1 Tax=Candidatus Johnevansia muelleri TaxID=1495769 RepID=A0A078KEJ3_9GAMM|nr:Protein grpE [Candidatus Evansia muelleri]
MKTNNEVTDNSNKEVNESGEVTDNSNKEVNESGEVTDNSNKEVNESDESDEWGSDNELMIMENNFIKKESLINRITDLELDLEISKDKAQNIIKDANNLCRIASEEVNKIKNFGLINFIKNLIPAIDSLEKSIENIKENNNLIEGLKLILKIQIDLLKKEGVNILNPLLEPFNPNYHEAMTLITNLSVEPNIIVDVLQKGYILNGRLIRPALVIVNKH